MLLTVNVVACDQLYRAITHSQGPGLKATCGTGLIQPKAWAYVCRGTGLNTQARTWALCNQ